VKAWGLTLCTKKPEWKSDTVTAVVVPPWIDSNDIVKIAWKKYNLSLGVGLNKISGKVFRIGHLGNLNEVCCILYPRILRLCDKEIDLHVHEFR
jgi:alanine-glyoxylate transaminase/serine-glyoxylate transaminase/serine-pyruvate transaminase